MNRMIWLCLFGWFSFLTLDSFGQSLAVVTLGDSLTEGAGDDGEGGGYPARLAALLQNDFAGSSVANFGISGDTSDDLINKQLQPAIQALNNVPAGKTRVATVWIGSNDLFGLYNWVCDDTYGNQYNLCEDDTFAQYSANINTILNQLSATGAEIYVALLDDQSKRPVMADSALRTSSFDQISAEDVQRMSTQVARYNAELARLAGIYQAKTVDFFHTTIFENWTTLSEDGNHPNGVGYDAIASVWAQALLDETPVLQDSSRWLPHITSFTGGFQTKILCFNPQSSEASVTLQPYSRTGVAGTAWTLTIGAHASRQYLSTDLWGSEEVSHVSISGAETVTVTSSYRVAQGDGASAPVNEKTSTGTVFLFYPGEQNVIFDGWALVNRGTVPCSVQLDYLDSSSHVLQSVLLTDALGVKEKSLGLLDSTLMEGVSMARITSSQPVSALFLRGTPPNVLPGYLYQVEPIVLE